MSAWGKLLAPITVPAGGWLWAWGDTTSATRSATLPAATYGTILSLADGLETALTGVVWSSVAVSETGIVTVLTSYMTSVHWSSCAADLLLTLGFNDEDVAAEGTTSATVTSTLRHRYGWYPGVISHGAARGEGLAGDSAWQVADEIGRVVAGTGAMRAIAPARRRYRRQIRFAAIRRSEYEDLYRGVAMLEEHGATRPLRWYPDRAEGLADAQGTYLDPATSRSDASGYYWRVTLLEPPAVDWSSQYPDLCSVTLDLNAEPSS